MENQTYIVEPFKIWEMTIIALFLIFLIIVMIIGNIFVIMAILIEPSLKRPQYYLILSLSLADLLVGLIVSPLAAVNELQRAWTLGVALCDFWICMDVMSCSASILHLVAIALDRYWSATDILYVNKRTVTRMLIMIAIVWSISFLLSIAPVFGWKDAQFKERVVEDRRCLISQDLAYQLVSTITAFYGPLIFIIVIYWQIFRAAKRRIMQGREKRLKVAQTLANCSIPMTMLDSAQAENVEKNGDLPNEKQRFLRHHSPKQADVDSTIFQEEMEPPISESIDTPIDTLSEVSEKRRKTTPLMALRQMYRLRARTQRSVEVKREQRVWRTLAIVTGAFVGCWLPFFVLSVVRPVCVALESDDCEVHPVVESVFLWLGYLNSAVNPVIYTIFSPDFRQAFAKILRRLSFAGR